MIIKYSEKIEEKYGPRNNSTRMYTTGGYISPNGVVFDVKSKFSSGHVAHGLYNFFQTFLFPNKNWACLPLHDKNEVLEILFRNRKYLSGQAHWNDDMVPILRMMKLSYVDFFINCYRSDLTHFDEDELVNIYATLEAVMDYKLSQHQKNDFTLMKEILVRYCNYDAIESQLDRTITTTKRNVYETFYDYLLMDYNIFQIPKKIYDEKEQKYIESSYCDFLCSDSELRLKEEIEAIRRLVPPQERYKYFRAEK